MKVDRYIIFFVMLFYISCSKNAKEACKIEKIFVFPIYRESKNVRGFTLTNNPKRTNIWEVSNYPIAVSDSSLCQIKKIIDSHRFINYKSYVLPRDSTYFYDFEVLVISGHQDTFVYKVINRIKDKDVFKKILDLIEFDKYETLKEQKRFVLGILRAKYDIMPIPDLFFDSVATSPKLPDKSIR